MHDGNAVLHLQVHDSALTSLTVSPDGQDLYCGYAFQDSNIEPKSSEPLLKINTQVIRGVFWFYITWFSCAVRHDSFNFLYSFMPCISTCRMDLSNLPRSYQVLVRWIAYGVILLLRTFIAVGTMAPWLRLIPLLRRIKPTFLLPIYKRGTQQLEVLMK